MVFQFTPLHLTLGGIERSNHWVLIWLCIIDMGTVKREYLAAIIFGGFSNINLAKN